MNTGRVPSSISFAQKPVTFFQVASWKLWRVLLLLTLRLHRTQGCEGQGRQFVGQGYGEEKGWALLGFRLSAGASPHSLLDSPAVCSTSSAGQGPEGGPRRHSWGHSCSGGSGCRQQREGVEPLPGGRGKRLRLSRPQRPELACGWVGRESSGPGQSEGQGSERWRWDQSLVPGWLYHQNLSLLLQPRGGGRDRQPGLRRTRWAMPRLWRAGSSLHSCLSKESLSPGPGWGVRWSIPKPIPTPLGGGESTAAAELA